MKWIIGLDIYEIREPSDEDKKFRIAHLFSGKYFVISSFNVSD